MYATKYWIRQYNGHIRVMYVMCCHCGCWTLIDKLQADQAHQCPNPECKKVFVEPPDRSKRDVFIDDLKGG